MNLSSWLVHTVSIASVTGKSSHGDPSFEAARTISARVQYDTQMVRRANGQETASNAQVFSTSPILVTDRIWLPGVATTDTLAKVPLSVSATPDKWGNVTLYMAAL